MLNLILVETALELVSSKFRSHPSVLNNVKKYGNPGRILDIALHHTFMKNLADNAKRGRPDILHHFILTCISSILNKNQKLRIFFHTYQNDIYEINPIMRPPKDFIRFKGLMYKLLTENNIAIAGSKDSDNLSPQFQENEKTYLIKNIRLTLPGLFKSLNPHKIFRFTSKGTLNNSKNIFKQLTGNESVVGIIGGFQSGFFSDQIMELDADDISIYPNGLETDAVVNRVIINFENSVLAKD